MGPFQAEERNERAGQNPKIPTGEIEILVRKLTILNSAELPP